ncbi:MAG: lysoplasmalogenase family protein [Alistipes communis]|uniref:lysoplasmalogenase family protein n=1 Tax=Alistipes communis TaxID=2585118 RepID=UPI003991646E
MRPCKRTSPACGGGGSPDEPDDGKYRRPVFIGALTLGFGLSVALFFSTGAPLPCKVCYPASWLSLVLFALLLSAAGDAAGAVHDFLLQMFLFALAHVAYIRYFLPSAEFSRRRIAAAAVVGAGLLLFLFAGIVPRVASSVERTGVALYGTVIAAMLLSVLFYRGRYAPGFRVAALLFVFSDATIAWNKFVEPLPDAPLRIMSTYYAAQYLFALLALAASSRKAAAARP